MKEQPPSRYESTLGYVHLWEKKAKFSSFESVHPNWLVFVVEDGSFYFKIGDKEGTASYGDLVVCPPETVFRRVVISPVTLFVVYLNWKSPNGPGGGRLPVGKISLLDTGRLSSTLRLMRGAYPADTGWSQRRLEHCALDLWVQYCHQQEHLSGGSAEKSTSMTEVDSLAREAAALLVRDAFGPLLLQDIARSLGVSLSSLSKRFKKSYGCSPIQYLTRLRLEKARTLLLETGLTLEQISECCGYPNGFYLSRVFVRHFGMTPAQFRKSHCI